ncbi:MAG TPA: C45 family peptidase [Pseudacidobacterium sp.]|nr:C45 family peptidase [Pseudacidobacterium sp.]
MKDTGFSGCRLMGMILLAFSFCASPFAGQAATRHDPRLEGAYSFERNGWTYIHLQGTPEQVGYQHGYLLADKIEDALHVFRLEDEHSTGRDWTFFRNAAKTVLWPHIDPEYQQEMSAIAKGAQAKGVHVDVWDIVALNGTMELAEYYVPWLNRQQHAKHAPKVDAPGNCSAFIATGSYTKGGEIVMAHNNWSSYAEGERWTMVFDIEPAKGHRILMDGVPGMITSNDDFGINDAGIMLTETTITQFEGWNSNGSPTFMRSRKALQYASSIDEVVATMRNGNNGGYANDWLIGDRKTGEIAYLELGLKNTPLWRTKDGYFVSSNFARDPKLIQEETSGFNYNDLSTSPNARRVRWEQLMSNYKGKIDADAAGRFLSDHEDSFLKKENPDQRSLCGHVDTVKEGIPQWDWPPYYPGGAVQGKVTTSDLAARMSIIAHAGHPCGEDFLAKPFLAAHPEFSWQAPILRDMKSGPWTTFTAGEKAN